MRILYLDDSGKPHPRHPSKCVSFSGFSVDETRWHRVVRQLNGAKARHYPRRGSPHDWELKSADFLSRNSWKRANNRRFCGEVVDILRRSRCTVYAVYFDKRNATRPISEDWIVPLCFQVLVGKFAVELAAADTTGSIVCDWSTHSLDRHVSKCVQSFVVSRELTSLVGGVTYASSVADGPVQIADLISGTFRIYAEGGIRLAPMIVDLRSLVWRPKGLRDVFGKPVTTEVQLF